MKHHTVITGVDLKSFFVQAFDVGLYIIINLGGVLITHPVFFHVPASLGFNGLLHHLQIGLGHVTNGKFHISDGG